MWSYDRPCVFREWYDPTQVIEMYFPRLRRSAIYPCLPSISTEDNRSCILEDIHISCFFDLNLPRVLICLYRAISHLPKDDYATISWHIYFPVMRFTISEDTYRALILTCMDSRIFWYITYGNFSLISWDSKLGDSENREFVFLPEKLYSIVFCSLDRDLCFQCYFELSYQRFSYSENYENPFLCDCLKPKYPVFSYRECIASYECCAYFSHFSSENIRVNIIYFWYKSN